MQKKRSWVFLVCATIGMMVFAGSICWAAGDFPSKPIELIVPYPAGGSTDVTARPLAKGAEKDLGQPIAVINKAGGGGTVGTAHVAKAKNKGYTLTVLPPAIFNAYYMRNIPFVPMEAFTPIMVYGGWSFGLVVKSDSPWKTLEDFIKYAKENPGKVKYSAPGTGTSPHLAMAELGLKAGVDWKHVPYKGDPPSIAAVLGGHVTAASGSSAFIPHVKAGKLRLLATYGDKRMAVFPNVRTLKECGYDISYPSHVGIAGPKGLPEGVVKVLEKALKNGMKDKIFISTMGRLSMPITFLGSADYKLYLKKVNERAAKLIPSLGLGKK